MSIAAAFQADADLAQADVILVQEAEAFPAEGSTRISRLAGALGMSWIYAPARPEGDGTLGDAILSRFPLDNFAVMHLPLATYKRQRVAISADLHVGTATIKIVTTQLDTTLNITDRVLQMHPLVTSLPDLAFVGGDFNTNPYAWGDGEVPVVGASAIVATDQAPMLDDYMAQQGFANFTKDDGTTEVRYGITSRLDAVYTRGTTVSAGAVNHAVTLSDHQPVWVSIDMPQ
jgi:endonuclease/exonuclease/phosphatase family metal-dependent hydrolase